MHSTYRKLKILMMQGAYFPWIGGAELFAQKTAEYLVKKGHEVDMITGLWSKPDMMTPFWNKSHENINGVNIYRVPTINIRYIKTISAILPMYKHAIRLHRTKHYDLIHAHIFPALVTGALLKIRLKIPLITTVQGGDLVDYKETTGAFGGILKPLISYCLKKSDIVHGVSSSLALRAKSLGAQNTIVIPNGVDYEQFRLKKSKSTYRKMYGYTDDDNIIVSTSRLTPKNGLDNLIRSVKELSHSINNLKVLIIGDGEQRSELEKLITRLNVEHIVFLLGYIPHDRIAEYLWLSDVFCRPSRDEGFGISFIEAMAAGLVVVATHVGGIPDIIIDKQNGFFVKPDDSVALHECLHSIFSHRVNTKTIVNNAIKTVQDKFSWQTIFHSVEKLYFDILMSSDKKLTEL